MAEMRRCLEIVIEKGENECIFCGEKIISGCLWSIGAVDKYICVGDCCKTNLIKMYKDIIQDSIESGMGNLNYEEMAIHGKSKLEIFEKNSNFINGSCSHLTRKAGFTKGFLSGII